jgi:hypothetical protein
MSVIAFIANIALRIILKETDIKTRSTLMINEAILVLKAFITNNLDVLLAKLIFFLPNSIIRAFRIPMITNYVVVAGIINLAFSFLLVNIMGSTQIAGFANLFGSLIAAVVHYALRKDKIKALQEELAKEQQAQEQ